MSDRCRDTEGRRPKNSSRKERLAKGLCPDCGAEAAPYRLCNRCRFKALLGRILNKAHGHGVVVKSKKGRESWYALPPDKPKWDFDYNEAQPGDGRLAPRLRNIPVDVERQLITLLRETGKPLQMEEIYEAWGKLRLRANRTSAAMDLAYIMSAKQKRAAKMARRAERHRKQIEADERRLATSVHL